LYYLYNNTSRNIPQDIFGKFDKKNKPIKAFGGFLFFISVKQPYNKLTLSRSAIYSTLPCKRSQ